jgi:hypothetical protein
MSVAINGTITRAATMTASMNMVSGTVYQALLPILIDGSTTSPNMSRGTRTPSWPQMERREAADYSER